MFSLMKKENVHQIQRRNQNILFITFETEKKYEIWIFFETNEFKKLTLFFLRNKNILNGPPNCKKTTRHLILG